MGSNLETIKDIYAAFGRGDVGFIVSNVTADVDWASETAVDGAPWYGAHKGPDGVGQFFTEFGGACEVEDFTPEAFATNDDGDVFTIVRFRVKSRATGRVASMRLHHYFKFRDGKIAYYCGTEDTALTVAILQA